MTIDVTLEGLAVLIVEDNFFQADDARSILEKAGAAVVGPFASAARAIEAMKRRAPDCAVIDVNLGSGNSFAVIATARALGIPFILTTGYDIKTLPVDLAQAPCLSKPLQASAVVDAVFNACDSRTGP